MGISFNPQEALAFIAKNVIAAAAISNGLSQEQAELLGGVFEGAIKGFQRTPKSKTLQALLHNTIKKAILTTFDSKEYEIPYDCRERLVDVFSIEKSYIYLKADNPFTLIVTTIRDICKESINCNLETLPIEAIATDVLYSVNAAIYENHQLTSLYTLFRTEEINTKLDDISTKLATNTKHDYVLICSSKEITKQRIHGREHELCQMENLLRQNNIIFVGGIDGIGKTTLVKQYFYLHREEYNQILYLSYEKDFLHLFCDDLSVTISNFSKKIKPDNTLENDNEYFYRKILKLKEITNQQTAIIIDGYTFQDEHYDDIISLNATLVFITSHDVSTINPSISIRKITNVEATKQIFFDNYSRKDIKFDDATLTELLSYFEYHTLSIVLIAKQMKVCRCSPQELLLRISKGGIKESLNQKMRFDISSPPKTPYELLLKLFKTSNLSHSELYILYFLCLLAPAKIFSPDLNKWMKENDIYITLDDLRSHGWIEIDDVTDMITIHPLVREIVLSSQHFELPKYSNFFDHFAVEYSEFELFSLPFTAKKYYAEIANNICNHLNRIDENIYPFCLRAERILSIGCYLCESLALHKKIEEYIFAKPSSYVDIANLYYSKGWTYATQYRDRQLGIIYFEKAINYLSKIDKWPDDQIERIANIYADYGIILCRSGMPKKLVSFEPIQKSIDLLCTLSGNTNDKHLHISWLYAFLAESYINSGKTDLAEECIEKAFKLHQKYSGKEDIFFSNILLRKSMLEKCCGKYEAALNTALQGYSIYIHYYGQERIANIEHLVYIGDLFCLSCVSDNKEQSYRNAEQYYSAAYELACAKYHEKSDIINRIRVKISNIRM